MNQNDQNQPNANNNKPKEYRYICCTFKTPESLYIEACCYDFIPLLIYAIFLLPLCCIGLVTLLLVGYQFTLKLELSGCAYNP